MNSGIPTINTNLNAVMGRGGTMPASSGLTLLKADSNLSGIMSSGIPTIDTNLKVVMKSGIPTINTNLNAVMQTGEVMPGASGITLGVVDTNLKTVMTTGVSTIDTNLKVVMNSGIPTINTNLNAVMQSGESMPATSGITLGTVDTNLKTVMTTGVSTIDTNLKAVMNSGIPTINTNLNAVMQTGEVMPGASGITLGVVDSNLKTVMTTGVATAANLGATGVYFNNGHNDVNLSIVTTSGIVTPLISGNSTATTTLDLSLGSNFSYKLAVADTDFQVKNVAQGQKFTLRTEQDSTASRTITWAMGSEIRWAEGGTAPTGTEYPAGVADYYGFVAVETGLFMGFVIGSNIK
jgi:hypothetical protein